MNTFCLPIFELQVSLSPFYLYIFVVQGDTRCFLSCLPLLVSFVTPVYLFAHWQFAFISLVYVKQPMAVGLVCVSTTDIGLDTQGTPQTLANGV